DKHLLRQGEGAGGEPRFGMLETIREFGLERLVESGELENLRQQHAAFFLELAEEATAKIWSAEFAASIHRLNLEHDNLRAALECSLGQLSVRDDSDDQPPTADHC